MMDGYELDENEMLEQNLARSNSNLSSESIYDILLGGENVEEE